MSDLVKDHEIREFVNKTSCAYDLAKEILESRVRLNNLSNYIRDLDMIVYDILKCKFECNSKGGQSKALVKFYERQRRIEEIRWQKESVLERVEKLNEEKSELADELFNISHTPEELGLVDQLRKRIEADDGFLKGV